MSASLQSLMMSQIGDAPRGALVRELLSFIAIGVGAALSFVALSMAAVALLPMLPAWLVSAVCYGAFVVPVYLLHRRFSFHSSAAHSRALPRYATVQLGGIGVAAMFSWLAYGVAGLPTLVAALVVIGVTSGLNFAVLRLWAFSR
jgi:putative flippase GtrA